MKNVNGGALWKNYYILMLLLFIGFEVSAGGSTSVPDPKSKELYNVIIGERDKDKLLIRVRDLVESGADINFVSKSKRGIESSVLSAAVKRQSLDLVKYLLEKGADPNPVYQKGCTPIGKATSYTDQKIIRVLISAGADLSKPSCYSRKGGDLSALANLLYSTTTVDDETRVFALEKHVSDGKSWNSKALLLMIYEQKYEVVRRMIELIPSSVDELVKKKIETSDSEKIRSLADLVFMDR